MELKISLLIIVICSSCFIFMYEIYLINVAQTGNTFRQARINIEKQTAIDCQISADACPACSGSQTDLSKVLAKKGSCDPGRVVEYNSQRNTFRIDSEDSGNEKCPREVRAVKIALPRTGLISFPGSGNTWTRHLIQQLTGLETGAVYLDDSLKRNGFPGEGKVDDVVVVKTHSLFKCNFTKHILIVRNPYDAMVAEYKRGRLRSSHAGQTNVIPNEAWRSYAERRIKHYEKFLKNTLLLPEPQLIVVYEDMKDCLLRELLRMSAFLSTPALTRFSICCTLGNSVGRYYRNQGRAPLYELYNVTLRRIYNDKLSATAAEVSENFPGLARRLLEYRLY